VVARLALVGALALAGCTTTSGDVLVSLNAADGAVGGQDARVNDGGAGKFDASAACAAPPDCPPIAFPGTLSVCGRVIDLATSQPIPGDGVISVSFFNFIDFGGGPSLGGADVDECGRFVAENVIGVLPGFVVMSADDDDLSGGDYVRVVSVIDSQVGQVVRANAYALRATREQTWSTTAGVPSNFDDVGALLPIFVDFNQGPTGYLQGAPVAGVTITQDGSPVTGNDYYFPGGGAVERDTVDPALTTTGADGSGLFVNALVTFEYSGEKAGCTFPTVDGLLFGAIQVQELVGTCN